MARGAVCLAGVIPELFISISPGATFRDTGIYHHHGGYGFRRGALAFLIDRLVLTQTRSFAVIKVLSLTVTSLDYIDGMGNPMGSVCGQAYLQANNLPSMQLAAITGAWGSVFLTNWLGSIVNWTWEAIFDCQIIKRGLVAYLAILLVVIVFGRAHLVYAVYLLELTGRHLTQEFVTL